MLYIRTDMNDVIATGHMMRCIAIAEAAKKFGESTTFLLADAQAVALLAQRGFEYIVLNTSWKDMETELGELQKIIENQNIKSILVDSYQATPEYFKKLGMLVKTVYIDDMNVSVYPVDALICYADYWEKFNYTRQYRKAELFLGAEYIPLRQEFADCKKKNIKPQVENLLLLSGGSDRYHALKRILEYLEADQYKRVDVICGVYNLDYEMLCEKYGQQKNIYIHKSVKNIEDYMINADVAITAGGTTLYELCAVGTPAISYSMADNQLENVKSFRESGLIDCAGDARYDDVGKNVCKYLNLYRGDWSLRQKKSMEMQKKVDGKGAERIAKILKEIS